MENAKQDEFQHIHLDILESYVSFSSKLFATLFRTLSVGYTGINIVLTYHFPQPHGMRFLFQPMQVENETFTCNTTLSSNSRYARG